MITNVSHIFTQELVDVKVFFGLSVIFVHIHMNINSLHSAMQMQTNLPVAKHNDSTCRQSVERTYCVFFLKTTSFKYLDASGVGTLYWKKIFYISLLLTTDCNILYKIFSFALAVLQP